MATRPSPDPYNQHDPKPGYRQALLTCYVGQTQCQQIEWVPPGIQPKAQVLVGKDHRVWIVEEIY
jgi:hypothetical protein